MKCRFFRILAAGIFLTGALAAEETWFASNPVGMQVKPINREQREEFGHYLSLEKSETREVRRLFARDEGEIRRWERALSPEGRVQEETEYRNGEKKSVKRFFPAGLIRQEILFSGGAEDGSFMYDYSEGRPAAVTFLRAGNSEPYQDVFQYYPSGEFRGIKRVYADGKTYQSLFSSFKGLPREEWHSFSEVSIFFRYDSVGNLALQEEKREGVLTERVEFFYSTEGPSRLRERRSRDFLADRETLLRYDPDGHPREEVRFERGARISVTRFEYQDNLLFRKERRRREGRELWEYQYDEGKEPTNEYYYVNGDLKRTILHTSGEDYSTIEEYYKGGSVFLRLYYKDGEEIKGEVIMNGQVVRALEAGKRP
jgi:antitoxin component YwqK of YwqJK toxin-antitoxin module